MIDTASLELRVRFPCLYVQSLHNCETSYPPLLPACPQPLFSLQAATPMATIEAVLQPNRATARSGAHALLCHLLSISDSVADATRPQGPPELAFEARVGQPASAGMSVGLAKQPSDTLPLLKGEEEDVELLRSFRLDRVVRPCNQCFALLLASVATACTAWCFHAFVAACVIPLAPATRA